MITITVTDLNDKLKTSQKAKQRLDRIANGYNDRRFKNKVETSKKHKQPKYKHKIFDPCY